MPQYLLTEDECKALVPRSDLDKATATVAALSRLVAKLTRGGCIHDDPPVDGYCDNCGMGTLERGAPRCPFPRNFSK